MINRPLMPSRESREPFTTDVESPLLMTNEPTITVVIPRPLRVYSGSDAELTLAASTVRAALAELEQSHPGLHRCVCDELGRVRRHINLFVNNDHIRKGDDLDTRLKNGDVLSILPAVSGG